MALFAIHTTQNCVHRRAGTESARAAAFHARATPTTRDLIISHQQFTRTFDLTIPISMPPSPASRSCQGALARHCDGRTGCGVLRVCSHASRLPGGARQHRPSATTSGTRECANARPKGTAHVQRPNGSPRRVGANKPPRWSAERRASPLRRKAPAGACGRTSLARRRVPLHPSACRRSAPLVGDEGKQASLGGGSASREG
jgi:hypothetical protein